MKTYTFLYKIAAYILIVAGIYLAIITLPLNLIGCVDCVRVGSEAILRIIYSVLILILSILPAKAYLKIAKTKSRQNKLTRSSLILTIVGIVLVIGTIVSLIVICPDACDGPGLMILAYGAFPAGFLYAISIILLIVNQSRK